VYNLIGGVLWTDGIVLIGYFVSKQITKLIPPTRSTRTWCRWSS